MFNFRGKIISFIKTMYYNLESAVVNNVNLSQFFPLERGIRQDCPLSACLLITTMKILATYIRNNPSFKGIR